MALSTKKAWENFIKASGVPDKEAGEYATTFVANRVTEPSDLTREILRDLGVTVIGDMMAIIKHAKKRPQSEEEQDNGASKMPTRHHKPHLDLPRLSNDITHAEFRKFRVDWDVYKTVTQLPVEQIPHQLYLACESTVQNSIINSSSDFFNLEEDKILTLLESIVTRQSNPAVHRLAFSNISQSDNETIRAYLVRLTSNSKDCEFECPSCKYDLASTHIKDQFIRGLNNSTLQTDILAKAGQLKTLESVVKHAEAFETAIFDQSKLSDNIPTEMMRLRVSEYKRRENSFKFKNPQSFKNERQRQSKCPGCGSFSHGSKNRSVACPAWGQTCHNCKRVNHFASVCRQDKVESVDVNEEHIIISHLDLQNDTYTSVSSITNIQQIPAEVTPITKSGNKMNTMNILIFPDSGAGICLAGTKHLDQMGIKQTDLIPCKKTVMAVGGSTLTCIGWIKVNFKVGEKSTCQPLYVCEKVDRIYFSRIGCTEVNILPTSFPHPMEKEYEPKMQISAITAPSQRIKPTVLPLPGKEENVGKLKDYLIKSFPKVFNRSTPFQEMKCKPAHIHLTQNAIPSATHVPIPIPLHWKEEVKENLYKDVENGIIEPVPVGEPVTWCSPMVVITKKDGRPRRTVDLQRLNSQCLRETHHCESPFKLACQVPSNTKKTVIDATDGYHAIPLDEESKPLTTFITEWGRFRYCRLPQGYIAAGDAYTRRYDEIIKDTPRKVKCIDDTLLWDSTIEESFFHVWNYLTLCEDNGITVNQAKFQFCQDIVDFAGLKITEKGISPSDKVISAIKNFPKPKDITGARSWFGLVNQIAWAYSNTAAMQPFRELVRPKSTFFWDDTLDRLFEESKEILIQQSIEGIRTFDTSRLTCLQTDWSREGLGYLLLQQYCKCPVTKAPVCCDDGWKLVFAGSRFTKGAETRYSPTEGEALAVTWALDHAKMFVLGCTKLLIATDHKPLLGIFSDRSLKSISNPRLLNLKQKTLPYHFTMTYSPGKWHRAPDALSRNPAHSSTIRAIYASNIPEDEEPDFIMHINDTKLPHIVITTSDLEVAATEDTAYAALLSTVVNGFPKQRENLDPQLKTFWNVKDRLSYEKNLVLLDDRIVIPTTFRATILNNLHSAHHGVSSMSRRANQTVYWPGMEADIRNRRYSCSHCNENAPSQTKEPYSEAPKPMYPFQYICMDYFEIGHHSYLSCVDRFSGWLTIIHFKNATSLKLISACRNIFIAYGVPEELSSDGGPQFTSSDFKEFLSNWGVHHRLSSVGYPQSNGRAELAVKSAKRLIQDNTSSDGSLDNDRAARAILQHRNTPIPELGLSPAQLLLHRQLRDSIPARPTHYRLHKDWILTAEEREKAFAKRNQTIKNDYNQHSRLLSPISTQTAVRIQEKGKWTKSGRVVETLPNRQYRIRMDGSGRVTLRNRRFLKPIQTLQNIIPSALQHNETLPSDPISPSTSTNNEDTNIGESQQQAKPSRMLKAIASYNKAGLREHAVEKSRLRSGNEY